LLTARIFPKVSVNASARPICDAMLRWRPSFSAFSAYTALTIEQIEARRTVSTA
jgi:hypothetical protein